MANVKTKDTPGRGHTLCPVRGWGGSPLKSLGGGGGMLAAWRGKSPRSGWQIRSEQNRTKPDQAPAPEPARKGASANDAVV